MPRLASLAMYAAPPPLADATRQLWAHLRDGLRAAGIAAVPDALDETIGHAAAWLDPQLLLAQTCGYPFVRSLRGRVRLIATPVYGHPGCDGALSGSVVVGRDQLPAGSIADLRGTRAAINDPMSNSGANLLRHLVAPHARAGRFFASVVETGSHLASLAAVAEGHADLAAIDCVTYANVARFAPKRLAGTRILGETVRTPGLPLITRGGASDDEVAALREALTRFVANPALATTCDTLGLRGFELLEDAAYDHILDIEREAVALGYSRLA